MLKTILVVLFFAALGGIVGYVGGIIVNIILILPSEIGILIVLFLIANTQYMEFYFEVLPVIIMVVCTTIGALLGVLLGWGVVVD